MFKEYLRGPLNKACEKVSKTLGETVTIRKGAVALSLFLIVIFFCVLSASRPFWVWRLLRRNDQVVILPHDPGNTQRFAIHNLAQEEELIRMACGRNQRSDDTARPQQASPPTARRKKR